MKPPPKQESSPKTILINTVLGVLWLALGCYSEFGTIPHPLVPIQDAFGLLVTGVGLGCGAAILTRYYPRYRRLVLYPVIFIMFFWQNLSKTSGLPLFASMAMFSLVTVILLVADFE